MSSAQRKLARGVEQIETLYSEARAYVDSKPYLFDFQRERRAANQIFCRCFATEQHAPPDHWPLLAGEAIQNVRSALDHAVWAAWRGIETNIGTGDHTQFVLVDSPADFKRAHWRFEGVPEPVRALIERTQPYVRIPQSPAMDPLAVLRALSNADKHRTLNAVASVVGFEMVGADTGVKIEEWDAASGKRLGYGRTPISSFMAVADHDIAEMSVNPSFTYGVRIEGMPLSRLTGIVHDVFETINEIETGLPPNPFATYPLQPPSHAASPSKG